MAGGGHDSSGECAGSVSLSKEDSVNASTIFNVVTLVILAIIGLLWAVTRKGLEEAAKEAAKAAIAEVNWDRVLARELEKTRGVGREKARVVSYAALWSRMRPTAIYDDSPFNRSTVSDLSKSFSDWYFSTEGGLMLSTPCRELYFALQDLLQRVGRGQDWTGERTEEPKKAFERFLRGRNLDGALALLEALDTSKLDEWPPKDVVVKVEAWKSVIKELPPLWNNLEPQLQFSIVQQVASALRTALSADLESRLR